MRHLVIKRQLDEDDVTSVERLLRAAELADGHPALDDHRWLDMALGGRHDFAALLASEPGHDHPVAYAQVTRDEHSWAVDIVIDPHHRYEAMSIGPEMLEAALDLVRTEGGGHVHHWVYKPTAAHDEIAARAGLKRGRDLYQLRRSLPGDEPSGIETRPFEVGRDEEAWLTVNNRAFDWHPEQGDWTLDQLQGREREPWFDREGFLLHERDGRLAGFCWTKVHDDHDPVLGEIYVVAVDPDFHGQGLGRALVLAGLDNLHRRHGIEIGMLYVDAENMPARRLYEKLGFTVDHIDRAFVGDVS